MNIIEKNLLVDGISTKASFSNDTVNTVLIPLLQHLNNIYKQNRCRILVFIGAPIASGKSTLAEFICELCNEMPQMASIQHLSLDAFHHKNEYLLKNSVTINGIEYSPMRSIKGWPETYDTEKLYSILLKLKKGDNIWCPKYDRVKHDPVDDMIFINSDIVIVEGLWMLFDTEKWQKIVDLADYKIALLPKAEFAKERAISRKIRTGMNEKEAYAYLNSIDAVSTQRIISNLANADIYLEPERNELKILNSRPMDFKKYLLKNEV